MGIRAIPLERWREFLKAQNLSILRTKGGHEMWGNDDLNLIRSIVVQSHVPVVPMTNIHTCLRTLGISNSEFEQLLKKKKILNVDAIRPKESKETYFAITYLHNNSSQRCVSVCAPNKTIAADKFYFEHGYKSPIVSIDKQAND